MVYVILTDSEAQKSVKSFCDTPKLLFPASATVGITLSTSTVEKLRHFKECVISCLVGDSSVVKRVTDIYVENRNLGFEND